MKGNKREDGRERREDGGKRKGKKGQYSDFPVTALVCPGPSSLPGRGGPDERPRPQGDARRRLNTSLRRGHPNRSGPSKKQTKGYLVEGFGSRRRNSTIYRSRTHGFKFWWWDRYFCVNKSGQRYTPVKIHIKSPCQKGEHLGLSV